MSFFDELKRRNVIRVAAAYLVVAWLVVQIIETIFPAFGFGDEAVRITVILLAVGFVPAVIVAWAFEWTPEGLMRESEIDRSASVTPQTGKRLDRFIIVVLVLALAYFALDKFLLAPQRQAEEIAEAAEQAREAALARTGADKSIAVLPFVDLSPEGDQEYFSDGIAEELLNLLARLPGLRVISRSSAFSYKGRNVKLAEIAQDLNVSHVLEGSVRMAGERVRITAQLVEAHSDTHVWSQTYDRNLDDVFAIQDEIAAEVVGLLKVTLLDEAPSTRETDPEAYSLYLQAHHLQRQGSPDSDERAIGLFEQALAVDPDLVPAWQGLATIYFNQTADSRRPAEEGFELAREAARKALSIDPDYAQSHAMLGSIALTYDVDLAASARHYERALALDPTNVAILGNAASLAESLGRTSPEELALMEYVVERDPVNPTGHFNLGISYIYAGRWDDALDAFERSLLLSPDIIGAHYNIGTALLMLDRPAEALAAFEREEGDEELQVKGRALALYELGRIGEFESALQNLQSRWGDLWPSEVAHVYAWTGDRDEAFHWLDRAVTEREEGLAHQFLLPFYRPIHDDPRWRRFREQTGTGAAQLAAVEFDIPLPGERTGGSR